MPPRNRWSDERIDDMANLVERNDTRLDATQNLVAALDLKVTEIERERRLGSDRHFASKIAVMSVILGQAAEIILLLVHH